MKNIRQANKKMDEVFTLVANLSKEEKQLYGERSLTLLADYPLYACQSNISYEDAIVVGLALFGSGIYTDENGNLLK